MPTTPLYFANEILRAVEKEGLAALPLQETMTWSEPRILEQGVMAIPSGGTADWPRAEGHVAYWVWIIAGQCAACSFRVDLNAKPEALVAEARRARKQLVDYVRERLAPRADGYVATVAENGTLPIPKPSVP